MSIPSHQTTLTALPSELRLRILESCSDLSTAKALASTCKAAYSTWLAFPTSICEQVLARTTRCYNDVQALTNAQEKTLSPGMSTYREYVRRLLSNTRCAERACDLMGAYYKRWMDLNDNEQKRFLRIFYTVWTFAVLYNSPSTSDPWSASAAACYLEAVTIHDLYIIFELWFVLNTIWRKLKERGQIPGAADLAEMSRELQRGSVDEGRRVLLTRNLEKARRVHLTLTGWYNAMYFIDRYIPDKLSRQGNGTGTLRVKGLGTLLLLDRYQHKLRIPEENA